MAAAGVASSGARTVFRLFVFPSPRRNPRAVETAQRKHPGGKMNWFCAAERSGEQAVIPSAEKRSPCCCLISFRERRNFLFIKDIPEKTFTEGISCFRFHLPSEGTLCKKKEPPSVKVFWKGFGETFFPKKVSPKEKPPKKEKFPL